MPILIAVSAVILAERALANPEGAKALHRGTHSFIHRRTTSYRQANLTDAAFTDATTAPCDFTDAVITVATSEGASAIRGREGHASAPPRGNKEADLHLTR